MKEKIEYVSVTDLVPFKNHPFKLREGIEKEQLIESIKLQGTIEPLVVRLSLSAGKYEVISGHRRLAACKELGLTRIPVIVKDLTDEQAITMMVDSNLHRENILPSERAFAYKMKYDALKHQGKRNDLTSEQFAPKLSTEQIADESGTSKDTIKRYIRLTNLIPELLNLVDEGRIAFTPAVELSYLTPKQQNALYEECMYLDATPSLSQAQRIKSLGNSGRLTRDVIYAVMSEEKPNQKEQVKFKKEDLQKYFPPGSSEKEIKETIVNMLESKQRNKSRSRGER